MIKTYPKRIIENITDDCSNKLLISILSTVETPLRQSVKDKYKDVLELRFDDLPFDPKLFNVLENKDAKESTEGLRICDYKDVYNISDFIDKWVLLNEDITEIRIHCSAGISRSGAVALGIAIKLYDDDLFKSVLENNSIYPNEKIVSLFIQIFNPISSKLTLRNMYRILDEKIKIERNDNIVEVKEDMKSDNNSELDDEGWEFGLISIRYKKKF